AAPAWPAVRSRGPGRGEQQHAVAAAKSERVAHRVTHAATRIVEPYLGPAGAIQLSRVQVAGHEPRLEAQQRDDGFERARGAERVTGPALGGAGVGPRAEHFRDGLRLDLVVLETGRAVQVDVVDVACGDATPRQRLRHGEARAAPRRMR